MGDYFLPCLEGIGCEELPFSRFVPSVMYDENFYLSLARVSQLVRSWLNFIALISGNLNSPFFRH